MINPVFVVCSRVSRRLPDVPFWVLARGHDMQDIPLVHIRLLIVIADTMIMTYLPSAPLSVIIWC
jgi:hypothetical protein